MHEIANTEAYTLSVDPTKNRIYFTVTDNGPLMSPRFVQDWEKARHLVSPGFTILMDASLLQQITREWIEASVKIHRMLVEGGLAGTAEILCNRVAEKLHINRIDRISRNCYAKEEIFTSRRAAEIWLDRISGARK